MRISLAFALATSSLLACTAGDDTTLTKDEARAAAGKGDHVDYCELFDWYGDGICDEFCANPDPDCGAELEEFRLSQGSLCPLEFDCNGFISVDGSGLLKVDYLDDLGGVVHEAQVPADVMAQVVPVLTDDSLLSLLSGSEPPCSVPLDLTEFMRVKTGDVEVGNVTTFCDQPEIQAARDVMNKLVNTYLPRFESFRLSSGGFCPPEIDCTASIELDADGTLRVDRRNEIPVVIHETVIAKSDLVDAIAVLTDAALVDVLSAAEPPCPLPTDVHEGMKLTVAGQEIFQQTTFCDQADVSRARDLMQSLADLYLPEECDLETNDGCADGELCTPGVCLAFCLPEDPGCCAPNSCQSL